MQDPSKIKSGLTPEQRDSVRQPYRVEREGRRMEAHPQVGRGARSLLLAAVLGAALALGMTSQGRAQDSALVFGPDEVIAGQTYGEWSAEWWQWDLSIPVTSNPSFDTTGQHAGVQQSRPVFFLAGTATGEPVTRQCSVPAGKPLFFPLITAECSNVEAPPFFGATDEERLACAQALIDDVGIGTLTVTIDGVEVRRLREFRVASPPFNFRMPAANNILFLPGVTSGRAASDGYWLMVKPLSPGPHVIHFEAALTTGPFAGFSQNVTYHLTAQ